MLAPGRDTIARVVGPLAAAAVALLAVAVLRGAPTLALHGDGAAWWSFVVGVGVTGCLGAASVTWIAAALRAGSPRLTATAAGLAVLSVGMAIAAARALDTPAGFPDGGLSVAAIVGALAVAVGAALPGARPTAARRPVLAAVAIFVVVEAAAAGSILAADRMSASVAWQLAASGLLIAAATLAGARPSVGFALLAAGFGALALARPGTVDVAPGLVALAGGGLMVAWRAPVTRADEAAPAQLTVEPAALLLPLDGVVPAEVAPIAAADDDEARQETQRLTRELRGTIEELMQTRRTVELQRNELARAAATDPLTGTASRRSILERLSFEAAEARRYTHPLAVLLLDVDGLTETNHAHGMAVGDAVLRELALRMRLRIRAADALGRHGADSFLAILPHTDERGAAIFADALRRRLSGRPIMTEAGELRISVSIGVAFVRPGMDVGDEELLAAADEALASAQAAGGNRIAFDRLHGLVRLDDAAADAEPG